MSDAIVETAYGTLRGVEADGVRVFRGIPYAAPPTGEHRFTPPRPAVAWSGVREATTFGPISIQSPSPLEAVFGPDRPPQSEDSLFLNVWAPASAGPHPVMVWIHGGAFLTGSGSTPWYDGTAFASRGDVVVVTLNYRLGALGFLHLADLGGERHASSGNVGILDQIAALRWVQENIAAFGGDAGNVTIFGESAGGMSVGTLLGTPAAKGLFHRAILQSGAASHVLGRDVATDIAEEMLTELGLGRHQLDELTKVPADRLLAAQTAVTQRRASIGLAFRPVVDGTTLPQPPLDAIAGGSSADVDVLVGTNLDEMTLFHIAFPELASMDQESLVKRADEVFGEGRGAGAAATYVAARGTMTPVDIWTAIQTDAVFRIPAIRLAERQSSVNPNLYAYLFTWATPSFGGRLRSTHALEIPFVFDNLGKPGVDVFAGTSAGRQHLARRMNDAWIAFAHAGDPNHAGLPDWPRYDAGGRSTMLLDDTCAVEDDPYGEERRLWDDVPLNV